MTRRPRLVGIEPCSVAKAALILTVEVDFFPSASLQEHPPTSHFVFNLLYSSHSRSGLAC